MDDEEVTSGKVKRNLYRCGSRSYSNCISLNDVYILSAVRTPIGCFQGKLSSLSAVQLATKALTAAAERACISKDDIQEVVLGCTFHAGLGQGPGFQAAIFSGLPHSTVTSTVNKACGSGMKAVMFACQLIVSNTQEVVAAGGTESLSNVPYMIKRKPMRVGNICMPDLIIHDGLTDMLDLVDVTHFAEETVKEYKFTRADQDEYALCSYSKAAQAQADNVFSAEMVPITLKDKKGEEEVICDDEEVKRLDVNKFRDLKPDIGKGGTITPGNSSGFHDGAAMLVLASGNYVLKKNLRPLARIVSYADANVDPKKFILAPSVAIPKALVRANLNKDEINRWEISETFAVTAMLNTKILKLNPDVVNMNGGAISLGHPFGMTGARIIAHLVHVLTPGEMGCASICHTPGGGCAVIIEKLN